MKNGLDEQYIDLLKDILENGVEKNTRNGKVLSVFGRSIRYKFKDGKFPLITTKKMYFKGIVTELLWFLRGDTNIKYLIDNNCHIWDGDAYKKFKNQFDWLGETNHLRPNEFFNDSNEILSQEEFINKIKTDDEFAKKWGDLGPVYGKQWRSWSSEIVYTQQGYDNYYINGIDQISNLINDLKTNPDSRRLMVNAWNVGELDSMVLPPCHYGFQVYTRELSMEEKSKYSWDVLGYTVSTDMEEDAFGKDSGFPQRAISLMWNQRSVDTFLGLPFNIASYGLLLEIIAKEVNMIPDELIGNLGDTHLYLNHIEQAKEQIGEIIYEDSLTLYSPFHNDGITKKIPIGSTREPYPLPKLSFGWFIESWTAEKAKEERKEAFDAYIRQMKPSDFILENYQSHPTIKAPLSN